VHARIAGFIASVEVKQRFRNPYDEKIEAVYTFPLPANAAVSDFIMTIGERRIRGIVRERAEAEELYAQARSAGHVAALCTEERPTAFPRGVATIEPARAIDVELVYFNPLPYEEGSYTFAFPMVVGPRYNPPRSTDGVGAVPRGQTGASRQETEVSYLGPGETSAHRLSLTVDLAAGLPLDAVASSTHDIVDTRLAGGAHRIELRKGSTLPNKDFVLRYRVAGDEPRPAFFVHNDASGVGT